MARDASGAAVTVSTALPDLESLVKVDVIVLVLLTTAVELIATRPLVTVMSASVVLHVTVGDDVRSCVNVVVGQVAKAKNWCVAPAAIYNVVGFTVVEVGVVTIDAGLATVSVTELDTLFIVSAAVIVVVPSVELAKTRPLPVKSAIAGFDELHDTIDVVSSVVPLPDNVSIAVNCIVVPGAAYGFAGVTVIELNVDPEPQLTIPIAASAIKATAKREYFCIFIRL